MPAFSKRTSWALHNNPLSIALENLQSQGVPILDLTESNPTKCGFHYPEDWLKDLSKTQSLNYAPEARGMSSARLAISNYYAQRGLNVPCKSLVLTSSTSEGYSFLLKLLTDPGDHILIPKPSYPLFQFLLELHDVEFDFYPLAYEGQWKIDRTAFSQLVTSKTKAVILVNPNNPTCSYVAREDITFLNEICKKHSIAIISDEVFLDYKLNKDSEGLSLANNREVLTFVLSGISKICGLPQMKLSWVAANGPEDIVHQALERLEIIADTYLSVNTPVQNALSKWLPQAPLIQDQILKRVQENLHVLKQNNLNVLAVEGGWYAVLEVPIIDSEESFVLELLQKDHILIHPGFFFDFEKEGFLIVSLLPQEDIFKKAIERIYQKIRDL